MTRSQINLWRYDVKQALACCLSDRLPVTLLNRSKTMTQQEIVDLFDSTNITLAELSRLSGWSVPALKKLLMGAA